MNEKKYNLYLEKIWYINFLDYDYINLKKKLKINSKDKIYNQYKKRIFFYYFFKSEKNSND